MCRLFGLRARLPRPVHRSLVAEGNSLRAQSSEHKDGWGIAHYVDATPEVVRGLEPAHADPEFERVCQGLASRALIAHVRLASIGAVHLRNAHPFVHERWTFAHNGTVREFLTHQAELEALLDPALRRRLSGETDSERCFYLFLTRLAALPEGDDDASALPLARALAQTLRLVSGIVDRPGADPSSMNFLVTDGRRMVATRRRRSLFFSAGGAIAPLPGTPVEELVIASEKIVPDAPWHEVPEDGLVGVDADLTFRRWSLAEL